LPSCLSMNVEAADSSETNYLQTTICVATHIPE